MISYESSNWLIKTWRKRWYTYAFFMHLFKNYLKIDLWINYFLNDEKFNIKDKSKLKNSWKDIIRYVELTKMAKYGNEK